MQDKILPSQQAIRERLKIPQRPHVSHIFETRVTMTIRSDRSRPTVD